MSGLRQCVLAGQCAEHLLALSFQHGPMHRALSSLEHWSRQQATTANLSMFADKTTLFP